MKTADDTATVGPRNRATAAGRDHVVGVSAAVIVVTATVAAWIVPAHGDVVWSGTVVAGAVGTVAAAVVHGALVPRWALSKREASSRRALVLAIIGLVTGLFFWPFGFPGALTSGAVVLGRRRRAARQSDRVGTAAVVVGVAGFAVVAILALLALTGVLPDWPPDRL
jgi:hypothetical protein